ncbi:MAG: carboxypeptidase regulatory-like domain-containing protein [Rikenellaceae bacterium]|nr:carboxypeptidase regulatory-like domain-containing protein [Rikenellaceae bacterium]
MKIKNLLILLFTLITVGAAAQDGGVKGRAVQRVGRDAIDRVKVTIAPTNKVVYTNAQGDFAIEGLAAGDYRLTFEAPEFETVTLMVKVGKTVKDINLVPMSSALLAVGLGDDYFAEYDTETANDAQVMPSSLSASKDVFNNIAGYQFSQMRFRPRGYDSEMEATYLNGVYFNDALTGYGPWSLWSGLNEATRNQEVAPALGVSDYGVGGIGGVTNINARASQMRKGFRSSVVNANNNYRFRVMVSYASGMLDDGWAYAFSFSTRQGGNDWINGTYYNAYGYFASVEKQLNRCHRFALTVLGAPTQRGVQNASTQEVYDMVGSNYYNSNWGYQVDKKRNARIRNFHEPIAMLQYFYTPNPTSTLMATASYRFGRNGYSALDWYDGADPRPDYYRYLPSYFERQGDYAKADIVRWAWGSDWGTRQIDWDRLYNNNYGNLTEDSKLAELNGLRRSNYVIEERHTDQRDANFKVQWIKTLRGGHRLNIGLDARYNRTEYYKKMKDLLGGDYWLDVDKYAERDFVGERVMQNNLDYYEANGHAPIVKEGDKYGYDYYAHVRDAKVWGIWNFNTARLEGFVAGEAGYVSQWREGLYRKGSFENNSQGASEKLNFFEYKAKGSLSYKISGANSLTASVAYMQQAPSFQSSFVSPRTRNSVTPNLTAEKVFSADLTYDLHVGGFKARVSGYYTTIEDRSKVISFYDDLQATFTNFAMSNIDSRYAGVEVGFSIPLFKFLNLNGAVSYGDYRYTSNPLITQTADNSAEIVLSGEKVYWKGYHVESTPQTAANLGLSLRTSNNIYAGIDVNYYNALYLSMNPLYRTDKALTGRIFASNTYEENLASVKEMTHQERFDNAFVLNANIGKNWYIVNRKYNLGVSLQVNNLLNNRTIRTGGYEQMRLREDESGTTVKYDRFDSKYFYLMGTTYYLNVYFRF